MKTMIWLLMIWGILGVAQPLMAQQTETEPEETASESVSGGTAYSPVKKEGDQLRDPFKSPFEIEKEEQEKLSALGSRIPDAENRLPYSISELELRGIYYQAQSGYRAIFMVGDTYRWWSAGTKFQDADLVNITDGAVVFKHYASGEDIQVREVVKELHRGEE